MGIESAPSGEWKNLETNNTQPFSSNLFGNLVQYYHPLYYIMEKRRGLGKKGLPTTTSIYD